MLDVILIIIAVLLGANALIGLVRWLDAEVFKPRKEAKTVKSKKVAPVKAPAKKPAPPQPSCRRTPVLRHCFIPRKKNYG